MALGTANVHAPGWVSEFRAFIMRGSVVDLAVGIIIGAAFTGVVQSLVKDLFNPLLGLLIGGIDFSNLFVTLKGPVTQSVADAEKAHAVTLNYGIFINTCIQFLIVSFAIFWVVRLLTRLRIRSEPAASGPSTQELLLAEIRDLLRDHGAGVPAVGAAVSPLTRG